MLCAYGAQGVIREDSFGLKLIEQWAPLAAKSAEGIFFFQTYPTGKEPGEKTEWINLLS